MNQDKYTIIGLIVTILILGVILGVRIVARQTNLSMTISESEATATAAAINPNMSFDGYVGENLTAEQIQNMLTEIEVYVIGVTKLPLDDRTVISLNLTTSKTAGTLSDYTESVRKVKQDDITEGHKYKVNLKNGLTETTKTMEIIIL